MKITFEVSRLKNRGCLARVAVATLVLLAICLKYFRALWGYSPVVFLPPLLPLLACVHIRVDRPSGFALLNLVLAVGVFTLYFVCERRVCCDSFQGVTPFFFGLNMLVFCILAAIAYVLTGRTLLSYGLSFLLLLGAEIVNWFVYSYRGNEITPMDLLSLRTAANVVSSYRFSLDRGMVEAVLIFLFSMCALFFMLEVQERPRYRLGALLAAAAASGVLYCGLLQFEPLYWGNYGTIAHGLSVNFLRSAMNLSIKKPDDYAQQLAQAHYPPAENPQEDTPNIIIVMNESFADLRVYAPDLYEGQSVTPFFDALTENTVRGFCLPSIYGGGTPNSEWEFLTGNSMSFLPMGSVPFNSFARMDINQNLIWDLRHRGYRCVAMHPFESSGWFRPEVYPQMGFPESRFVLDFPQQDLVRELVSDQELYEEMIRIFAEKAPGERLCLYAVSMQNHGSYTYSGDFDQTVSLEREVPGKPELEQYLSLLQRSDQSLEYLISYFSQVPEDTVIVFFGDHQPNMKEECLQALYGRPLDTLDDMATKYKVPFFVWANYDIPEQTVELTSINYLSTYLYQAAGWKATGYEKFLEDAQAVIPVINAHGFYSPTAGKFLTTDEAQGEELEMLRRYRALQYNNISDRKAQSDLFRNRMP